MFAETERLLEFDKIVRLLSNYTQTEPGRELALAIKPLGDTEAVRQALLEVDEAVALLEASSQPGLGGLRDLREVLDGLKVEGNWLDVESLQAVLASLETAAACSKSFRQSGQPVRLSALVEKIDPLKSLAAALRSCIGVRGEILDSASARLATLRHDITAVRNAVRRQMEGMLASDHLAGALQDRLVTERNGRYVLPVKVEFKAAVKGFVHDTSASGQTLFVEPEQVLEKNNRLQALLRDEQQEEIRILQELSTMVAEEKGQLMLNQEIIARLDLRLASARFSRDCDGRVPRLVDEPVLELKQARHPLLLFAQDGSRSDEVTVPIDLEIGSGCSVLVLSGPNTGGKTVALKTAGLLLLMVRAGLHVPCHPDSRIHLFAKLFADIGDEQSIEAHLSTFSGHLSRLRHILEQADADSLVLFDEAGTGTDPGEGAALILAAIDALRERGSRVVLTTHLNLIKGYAQLHDDVENAAVEFDPESLRPTYRLHYGIPGESGAFTIARHYGLPEDMLQRAATYLGRDEEEGRKLVSRLNDLVRTLDAEKREASELLETAERERKKRKDLLEDFEQRKGELLARALRKGEQVVKEAEREVHELLSRAAVAERQPDRVEIAAAVKEVGKKLERAKPTPAKRGKVPKEVRPGEILHIPGLGTDGEVVRVRPGEIELNAQGKKLRMKPDQLEQYSPCRYAGRKKKPPTVRGKIESDGFESRLLLVGKRVDAALPELERFLDQALLQGAREVEVVHGAGQGILRKAVREALAGHRDVAAFYAAAPDQGGNNVTIIEMRT